MKLLIPELPGRCRWCGCTDDRACDVGCSWVDKKHTLCSACDGIDRAMQTRLGRRMVAWAMQESELLGILAPTPRPPRRRPRRR